MKNINQKSVLIWNLESLLTFITTVGLASIIFYFFNEFKVVERIYYLLCAVMSYLFIKVLILNPIIVKTTKYELKTETLYIKSGGISISETTIPLKRIQHVDIEQSFYSRLFNLYSINFYTAGDSHHINFINKEEAESLKENIVSFVSNMGVEIDG